MTDRPTVQTLDALLVASKAELGFKEAVRALARGERQERIEFTPGAPPVKVLRLVSKILEELPEEPIERLRVQASSGCSNFTGSAVFQPGEGRIEFDWDCRWRAQEMGWRDYFGDPDQIRAAHEFGYQCFRQFTVAQKAPVGKK